MNFTIDFDSIVGLTEVLFEIFVLTPLVSFFMGEPRVVFKYEFPASEIDAMNTLSRDAFPERFVFGVASYPTQKQGSLTDEGKFTQHQTRLKNHLYPISTCDTVCEDTYAEDITLAESLEVGTGLLRAKIFKISLCWPCVLPNGFAGPVNETSIEYYNDVIDEMLAKGITPMITLFQSGTPYTIQELGGWTNQKIVEWFEAYAKIAFATLGDKVKYWITIDDPFSLCTRNYGDVLIPSANLSGIADYMCGHNVLLAHTRVYNLYKEMFSRKQNGKVGIIQSYTWFEPENQTSKYDVIAVELGFQWYNGWLTNPLFHKKGGYPKIMKDRIDFKSRIQEFASSRLPSFTEREINETKGTADFVGVNLYTFNRIRGRRVSLDSVVSFNSDADVQIVEANCSDESWIKHRPRALGKLLRRLNNDYVLPEIYITGNDCVDSGKIQRNDRDVYYQEHITEVLRAMQVGIDIRGYLASSQPDNFEWPHGCGHALRSMISSYQKKMHDS